MYPQNTKIQQHPQWLHFEQLGLVHSRCPGWRLVQMHEGEITSLFYFSTICISARINACNNIHLLILLKKTLVLYDLSVYGNRCALLAAFTSSVKNRWQPNKTWGSSGVAGTHSGCLLNKYICMPAANGSLPCAHILIGSCGESYRLHCFSLNVGFL